MIAIVVLNYNTWGETEKCVRSLLEINTYKDIYIYIVDNQSTVDVPQPFADFVDSNKKVELIWNDENKGYNAGNNVGIKKALQGRFEYILISNNDVTYEATTLGNMVKSFDLDSNIGIVGPKIIEKDGNVQEINMLIPTTLLGKYKLLLAKTTFRGFVRKYMQSFSADRSTLDKPFFVHSVSGACLLMSRECCEAVYPFDEFPFLYEEEIMLGYKLAQTKYKTLFDTNAIVHHVHGASTHGIVAFSFTEFVRSEIYYCLHYLHNNRISVMPLYCVRCVEYFARCFKHSDYRHQLKRFFSRTKESFKSI